MRVVRMKMVREVIREIFVLRGASWSKRVNLGTEEMHTVQYKIN
jgi:hypothetical protein